MAKAKSNWDLSDAERAAQAVLARRDVRRPDEIFVERLACAERAYVRWCDTGSADARVLRGANHARIDIAERDRGTPRGRWSGAHEFAHWMLHRHVPADALDRIHGVGPIDGREFNYERQADQFTSELLMPRAWFAPLCTIAQPTIDDLDSLACDYGTSLTSTGKRFARFATSACAMLECWDGVVKRAARSERWRGVALQKRALEPGSRAYAIGRGESVASRPYVVETAWGCEALGVEMTEHVILIPESGVTLVWLWHAPVD